MTLAKANTATTPVPRAEPFHQRFLQRAQEGDIDILFIGDSITQYWEDPKRGKSVWDREYAPLNAACFGINGDRTQHILWRLQNGELEGIAPQVVVLMAGTNNLTPRNTTREIEEGLTQIIDLIRVKLPDSKLLLLAILPRNEPDSARRLQSIEINKYLEEFAATDNNIVFLDIGDRFVDAEGKIPLTLMPDQLHPNTEGYVIFAEAINPTLHAMMSDD